MSNIHRKEAFQHAVRCLAHPFSLLSMAVLFINDYCLRIVHPSWLTGKLGDFAWLFFFPIFLTTLLVWVLPKKWLKDNTPILIGIGVTTVVFTLGKTVAAVLELILQTLEWVIPWEFISVVDPTDLIALPVMVLTYLLWKNLLTPKSVRHPQWKYLLIGAVGLLTMGNMAEQPSGINCVDVIDDTIYVRENFGVYKGSNGGMEWEMVAAYDEGEYQVDDCEAWGWQDSIKTITDPNDSDIQYRFNTGESIERSSNGGKTWVIEFSLDSESEAIEAHYQRGSQTGYTKNIPHDADFDPETGNLIMTMSFDGLLVRTTDGEYHWIPIHNYSHQEINWAIIISLLLPGDIAFALFLGTVSAGTFRWKGSNWVWKVFLFLLLAGTLVTGFIFQPARYFLDYMTMPILLAVLVGGVTALTLYTIAILKTDHPVHIMVTGFVVNILHIFPLILWGYNIIPWYQLAFGIGVVLSIGWTVFRYFQYAKLRKKIAKEMAEKASEE